MFCVVSRYLTVVFVLLITAKRKTGFAPVKWLAG